MKTIRSLIKYGASKLPNKDSAHLDAELLLCHALNQTREQLYCGLDNSTTTKVSLDFIDLIERRTSGIPIAYLLNKKEFRSIEFFIDESVLVPRPDTETLVELVLEEIKDGEQLNILELGTGSGVIAATIAKERPSTLVVATELSYKAIKIAKKNIKHLKLKNVILCVGDWSAPLKNKKNFDIIVSNPPYISHGFKCAPHDGICFEPKKSLFSLDAGLADLRKIIAQAPHLLAKDEKIFLEHGAGQANLVRASMKKNNFTNVQSYHDLGGLERVTVGEQIF